MAPRGKIEKREEKGERIESVIFRLEEEIGGGKKRKEEERQ